MREVAQYVVLEWVHDLPGYPRYSFATVKHAEELEPNVRWLQTYPEMEMAAEAASELNVREASSRQSGRIQSNEPERHRAG